MNNSGKLDAAFKYHSYLLTRSCSTGVTTKARQWPARWWSTYSRSDSSLAARTVSWTCAVKLSTICRRTEEGIRAIKALADLTVVYPAGTVSSKDLAAVVRMVGKDMSTYYSDEEKVNAVRCLSSLAAIVPRAAYTGKQGYYYQGRAGGCVCGRRGLTVRGRLQSNCFV